MHLCCVECVPGAGDDHTCSKGTVKQARDEELDQWCLEIRKCLSDEHVQRQHKILALVGERAEGLAQTDAASEDRSDSEMVGDAPAGTTGLKKQICDFIASGCGALPAVVDTETLIYLDVDGVLNVGVHDPGRPGVLLSDANADLARTLQIPPDDLPPGLRENIARLNAVLKRRLRHGDSSYADFTCSSRVEYSELLVQRLAFIIALAGPRAEVILSSAWRFPTYKRRAVMLERAISRFLGQRFTFKRHTPLRTEVQSVDRLRTIAAHVAALGYKARVRADHEGGPLQRLRILVLDDFNATSFKGGELDVEGDQIRSTHDAATYLQRQYGLVTGSCVSCAVVHPFDEWTASDGLNVRMATGLTLDCVCQAAQFLGQECPDCSQRPPSSQGCAA